MVPARTATASQLTLTSLSRPEKPPSATTPVVPERIRLRGARLARDGDRAAAVGPRVTRRSRDPVRAAEHDPARTGRRRRAARREGTAGGVTQRLHRPGGGRQQQRGRAGGEHHGGGDPGCERLELARKRPQHGRLRAEPDQQRRSSVQARAVPTMRELREPRAGQRGGERRQKRHVVRVEDSRRRAEGDRHGQERAADRDQPAGTGVRPPRARRDEQRDPAGQRKTEQRPGLTAERLSQQPQQARLAAEDPADRRTSLRAAGLPAESAEPVVAEDQRDHAVVVRARHPGTGRRRALAPAAAARHRRSRAAPRRRPRAARTRCAARAARPTARQRRSPGRRAAPPPSSSRSRGRRTRPRGQASACDLARARARPPTARRRSRAPAARRGCCGGRSPP